VARSSGSTTSAWNRDAGSCTECSDNGDIPRFPANGDTPRCDGKRSSSAK
jgi:hypothetical protein